MNNEKKVVETQISGRSLISQVRSAFAFREELLLRKSFQDKATAYKVKIIAFDDSNLRDVEINRKVELIFNDSRTSASFSEQENVILTVLDKTTQVEIPCVIKQKSGENVILVLPKEGVQKTTRLDSRLALKSDDWTDALIMSESHVIACVIRIDDFSETGIGITLVANVDLSELGKKFRIQGDFRSDKFEFIGPYEVVRYSPIESGQGVFEYSVGLENNWPKEDSPQRASRFSSELFLNLQINISGVKIQATVNDVSFSGFKAKVSQKYILLFVRGLVVTELSSLAKFVVVRKNHQEIAFRLISQEVHDRIRWINIMVPSIENGSTSAVINDPRDLLGLFFEAGATVADGLGYNRLALTKSDSISVMTEQSDVVIRWVNVADDGSVLGHHSTYRVGINSWYTGDVVGGQNEKNRADRDFFNNNFKFLREIFEAFPTTQKILGSWKPDHPYWQTWRNYLIENDFLYARLMCDTVSRRQIKSYFENIDEVNFNARIYKPDSKEIFRVMGSLNEDTNWLLGALDVAKTDQYFEGLRHAYTASVNSPIKRECRVVEFLGSKYFVVFCQLPNGITVNPNFDTAFVFPINLEQVTQATLDALYSFIIVNGSKIGHRLSTVRYFSNYVQPIGIYTEFFVTDSKGLGIFK